MSAGRSGLAYVRRPGPLGDAGALASSCFLGAFVLVAFVYSNPIVLAGAGTAAVSAGLAAGAGRALGVALRWGLWLSVLIVTVNGVASQRGETILVRGWDLPVLGQVDISAEALAEGGVLALRIVVVMLAFAVHTACVDPDRVMRLLRPLARRSALTASLIARMVPLAARDHARLREAAALRGPAAAPVGRAALVRRLVAGALDRSVEVAATLELRGYGRGLPGRPGARRRSRHDRGLLVIAAAVAVAAIAGRVAGVGEFDAYPTLSLDAGLWTLALTVGLALAAALPFGRRWSMGTSRLEGARA
jgi:energy-coupling factor transport system permease protein